MISKWFRRIPPDSFNAVLPSGLAVQVGFVTPLHIPRFVEGYKQLSEQSRRMRFFGQVSGLSSRQLEFLTKPDGRDHIAYAALDLSQPAEPGIGVVRAIRLDKDSKIAEVALTILDRYQGQGAGQLLHAAVHVHAAQVGIEQFLYDVSAENTRFSNHLLSLGANKVSHDMDVVRLMLPVMAKPADMTYDNPAAEVFRTALKTVRAAEAVASVA
jgi:GNAT superfamily N-acetyltransferase